MKSVFSQTAAYTAGLAQVAQGPIGDSLEATISTGLISLLTGVLVPLLLKGIAWIGRKFKSVPA